MIIFQNSKIQLLIISAVEFLMGVYIALTRINAAESLTFFSVFSEIRQGIGIDITSQQLDINILISILNIIVSIPLIGSLFSKKYLTKCCYIATREKNYWKFYSFEMLSILAVCIMSGVLYNAGIFTITHFKYGNILSTTDLSLFFTAIVNSEIILFTVVMVCALVSTLSNNKIGIIFTSTFTSVLSLTVFSIPYKFKQFNMISWYFTDLFLNEKTLFTYPIYLYYLFIFTIDIIILCIGGAILKKRDTL